MKRQEGTQQLYAALQERILVLDGAMGTMLQRYKFSEEDFRGERFMDWKFPVQGNNDMLSITQPQAIADVHRLYFEAGADIVETNTFSGTTIAMADYKMEDFVYELNFESAKIARNVADDFTAREPHKPRFVAGAMGPTNKTASMSPDVNDPGFRAISFDALRIAYKQQAQALLLPQVRSRPCCCSNIPRAAPSSNEWIWSYTYSTWHENIHYSKITRVGLS